MATAANPAPTAWVGDARRSDELCQKCFLPSLIEVPFYIIGIGTDILGAPIATCMVRYLCRDCGARYFVEV